MVKRAIGYMLTCVIMVLIGFYHLYRVGTHYVLKHWIQGLMVLGTLLVVVGVIVAVVKLHKHTFVQMLCASGLTAAVILSALYHKQVLHFLSTLLTGLLAGLAGLAWLLVAAIIIAIPAWLTFSDSSSPASSSATPDDPDTTVLSPPPDDSASPLRRTPPIPPPPPAGTVPSSIPATGPVLLDEDEDEGDMSVPSRRGNRSVRHPRRPRRPGIWRCIWVPVLLSIVTFLVIDYVIARVYTYNGWHVAAVFSVLVCVLAAVVMFVSRKSHRPRS